MGLLQYVGERIRDLRLGYGGQGVSQETLAKAINVTPNTISRWETATYKPGLEDLDKLARFFGVSILEFFPKEEVKPEDERLIALLRAAKQLEASDLDELHRYAEYRRARHALETSKERPRPGRKRRTDQ